MIGRHISRCLLAGLVALLPVGGLVLGAILLENSLAGSWLAEQPYYFPGLGIVAGAVVIYLIGLGVSSFVGRWAWRRVDALLDALPAIGRLYQTLKQILGYGEGENALFREVVTIPGREGHTEELGLITNRLPAADEAPEGRLAVFIPGAPNPTLGRLVYVDPAQVRPVDLSVNDALTALLAVGNTPVSLATRRPAAAEPDDSSAGA